MYNRYIPQPDGSYRKRSMQEASRPEPQKRPNHNTPPCPPASIVKQQEKPRPERPCQARREQDSITGFFKNLLPKDMDAGDLMVILLLLLMAGDCDEDKNTALLTLALYFFM